MEGRRRKEGGKEERKGEMKEGGKEERKGEMKEGG